MLVVAHRTAASPRLLDAVRHRTEQGPCRITLLVPRPYWDPDTEEAELVVELAVPVLERAAGRHVGRGHRRRRSGRRRPAGPRDGRRRRDHRLHAAAARVALAAPGRPGADRAARPAGHGRHGRAVGAPAAGALTPRGSADAGRRGRRAGRSDPRRASAARGDRPVARPLDPGLVAEADGRERAVGPEQVPEHLLPRRLVDRLAHEADDEAVDGRVEDVVDGALPPRGAVGEQRVPVLRPLAGVLLGRGGGTGVDLAVGGVPSILSDLSSRCSVRPLPGTRLPGPYLPSRRE